VGSSDGAGQEDPLECEEAGREIDEHMLEAEEGFEEGAILSSSPDLIEGDACGEDLLDAEASFAEQMAGGLAGVEMEVSTVEDAAVHHGEAACEEHEAYGQVSDVREGDDEEGVVGGGVAEAAEGGQRIDKVFEDVSADDGVVGFWGEVGVFDGGGEDSAVETAGVLGVEGVGFDGVEKEIAVEQQPAEEALGGPDIENRLRPEALKKASNLLMAALGVVVQPVVEHAASSDGRVRT